VDVIKVIKPGLEYIEQNLKTTITAEELACIAGYSIWHYSHLFTKATGMPVSAYINKRRLDRALDEIVSGRRAIAVAMEYGFMTYSGFYKAFVRIYGDSPKKLKGGYPFMKIKDVPVNAEIITDEELRSCIETMTAFSPLRTSREFCKTILKQDEKTIQNALAELDPKDLVIALKGCNKASIIKVLNCLNKNIAMMIIEDIEHSGSLPDDLILSKQKIVKNCLT
jgi:AraC-like DNA-binding protein